MDFTNIFLIQLSVITIGITANMNLHNPKHENILKMISSFHRHHETEHIHFYVEEETWKNQLHYKFLRIQKDVGEYISVLVNQNLVNKAITLNIFMKKDVTRIQELFINNNTKVSSDYWLVEMDNNDESRIQKLFSALPLNYASLVFPFYYSKNSIEFWEVYKISPKNLNVQLLKYGNWNNKLRNLKLPTEPIWKRRQNLQGHFFRISAVPNKPYITQIEDGCTSKNCFKGMYPDVWNNLQVLMNFTYEVNKPPDRTWGTLKNGKWNGMIRQLVEDEIDIAPVEFTITEIRSQAVDFLVPISESHQRLFVVNPAESNKWSAFIDPLKIEVWYCITLSCIVLPPIFAIFMLYGHEPNPDQFTLSKCYNLVAGIIAMKGWSSTPKTNHNRIIFFSILIIGAIVPHVWKAMLVSKLAVRTTILPINSMEELAYMSDINVLVRPGTAYADTFRYGSTPLLQKIWKERIEPYIESMPYPKNKAAINEFTVETEFAMFDNYISTQPYKEYQKCQITDIPVIYFPEQLAYGIQKGSPFFGTFWYHMSKLNENGAFEKLIEPYESEPQVCPDYSGQPINLGQCFTAFVLLLIGILIGLFLWLFEMGMSREAYIMCFSCIDKTFNRIFNCCQRDDSLMKDLNEVDQSLYISELETTNSILQKQLHSCLEKLELLESIMQKKGIVELEHMPQ